MTTALSILLPVIDRITRVPGLLLVLAASTLNTIALFLAWRGQTPWITVAALATTAVLAFFALRRFRLANRMDSYLASLASPPQIIEDGKVLSPGMQAELERQQQRNRRAEVRAGAQLGNERFLPRLAAAQRSAIAAAGGVENAPHLRDDLRWTLLSAIATIASLPLLVLLIIIAIFSWS